MAKLKERDITKTIIMPKSKRHKYERVKQLPNVTFSEFGISQSPYLYPWYDNRYESMEKVLELGCGKAEHSLAFAADNPGNLYVGIDSKSPRICVGAEKAMDKGLENIFFLRAHIERIEQFFIEHSIHQIWLTFPDPHPKNRSIKNRLSAPQFLDAYASLLIPGGTVFLKTDSELFYTYTQKSVELWGGRVIAKSDNIHEADDHPLYARNIVSAFEKAARLNGSPIKYLAFQLTPQMYTPFG
ncbi:MAG: tRNA (guanosine(46)-N7)-methyltransferase TrmB [Desulfobacteraceae bacterium]|nr:tRNA (guanosine(46)-N7)-methyltransferase TrmB [Desulfobacteraceae bacterium]